MCVITRNVSKKIKSGKYYGKHSILEKVLQEAGYELSDVVRIDYYTTAADLLMANWDLIAELLTSAGCRAGDILLGVSRLAITELLIEIQAIAVK